MIRRILVALDPDQDTPVATEAAIKLARIHDASVTGLAVVDTSNIYPTGIIGDPDQTHHARNLWEELTDESREMARKLLDQFEARIKRSGVRYSSITEEGASFDRIVEGMKYHDLFIAGRDSHFFYNEPEKDSKTLAQVVKYGVAPTLVVLDDPLEISDVLIAYDGSRPASRSLKSFAQLSPFGKDLNIEILTVSTSSKEPEIENAENALTHAVNYLKEHRFDRVRQKLITEPQPAECILERQQDFDADLTVLGAHAVSALKRLTFGSTTHEVLTRTQTPLLLTP
jgi:nucleotide-binding universal stress UspA family protein